MAVDLNPYQSPSVGVFATRIASKRRSKMWWVVAGFAIGVFIPVCVVFYGLNEESISNSAVVPGEYGFGFGGCCCDDDDCGCRTHRRIGWGGSGVDQCFRLSVVDWFMNARARAVFLLQSDCLRQSEKSDFGILDAVVP